MAQIPAGSFTMGADDVDAFGRRHQRLRRHVHPPRARRLRRIPRAPRHHQRMHSAIATHLITVKEFQQFDSVLQRRRRLSRLRRRHQLRPGRRLIARGSQRKPASPIAFPPKRNGNTLSAPARRRPFFTGDTPPAPGQANAWGVVMGEGTPEWVADWYGPYVADAQTDPTGPRTDTSASSAAAGSTFENRSPAKSILQRLPTSCARQTAPAWRPPTRQAKATSDFASCRRPRPHRIPRPPRSISSAPM